LEFDVRWKDFEDCTWEPAKSFEKGGVKILEEFLKAGLDSELEQYGESRRFAVRMDTEVDWEQYEVLDIIEYEETLQVLKICLRFLIGL
jgi:hypothetical protein